MTAQVDQPKPGDDEGPRLCGNCRFWKDYGKQGACFYNPPRVEFVTVTDVPSPEKRIANPNAQVQLRQVSVSVRPETQRLDIACGFHRYDDEATEIEALSFAVDEIRVLFEQAAKRFGIPSGRVAVPGDKPRTS